MPTTAQVQELDAIIAARGNALRTATPDRFEGVARNLEAALLQFREMIAPGGTQTYFRDRPPAGVDTAAWNSLIDTARRQNYSYTQEVQAWRASQGGAVPAGGAAGEKYRGGATTPAMQDPSVLRRVWAQWRTPIVVVGAVGALAGAIYLQSRVSQALARRRLPASQQAPAQEAS